MATDVNTSIDDFVKLVHVDCPGGPDFLKKRAVCQAAIEFFKKTRAWREFVSEGAYVDVYNPEFDVNSVARQVAADVTVMDIDDVWLSADGTRLKRLSVAASDVNRPDWRSDAGLLPTGFFVNAKRRLRVYPAPKQESGLIWLDLELVLLPALTAERFPDFAYDIYGETIAAGAVQRLKSQTGLEWSDPKAAEYFLKKFLEGIHEARVEQARRITRALNEQRRRCFR